MILSNSEQIPFKSLINQPFDMVLAASGFEERASFIPRMLTGSIRQRIALAFSDRNRLARTANDSAFRKLSYSLIKADGGDETIIDKIFSSFFSEQNGESVNILVDYSSMTRTWYAQIVHYMRLKSAKAYKVNIYFCYSLSKFSAPKSPGPNKHMRPLKGYCQLQLPDVKSALVIGLGYEADKAIGLMEYVEPAETYAFYADPAYDKKFPITVKKNNAEIFQRLKQKYIFSYPMKDLNTTSAILSSLCNGLSKKHRIILAPLGPKPFSLVCLILSSQNNNFDVWRVSGGTQDAPSERRPSGDVLACKVSFA